MVTVIKKNKQLQVPDEKLEEFLELGYNQIDENGKVVKTGKPITLAAYQEENRSLKSENTKLKKEVDKLKKEISELKIFAEANNKQ